MSAKRACELWDLGLTACPIVRIQQDVYVLDFNSWRTGIELLGGTVVQRSPFLRMNRVFRVEEAKV